MKNKYINKSEVDKLKMMVADIDVGMSARFQEMNNFQMSYP